MWAWTGHAATVLHLQDLTNKYNIAQDDAKGRNKRLKNFGSNPFITQSGPVPVVRTACGPLERIGVNTTTIAFPLLDPAEQWHQVPLGSPPKWGPLRDVHVHGMQHQNFSSEFRGRAKWLALPSEFKGVTAGLLHITENKTVQYRRACASDARWANGSSFGIPRAWNAAIGNSSKPSGDPMFAPPRKEKFFDNADFYGRTIKADQEWLDEMSPLYEVTSDPVSNVTVFEAILRSSLATETQDPTSVLANESYARILLEYATTLYLLDAISRTGLSLQFVDEINNRDISRALQAGFTEPGKFLVDKPIFNRPDPSILPTTVSHVNMYRYGTAWILHGTRDYISVAILGTYLVIVVTHIIIVVGRNRTIEGWDSINELLALAWNSVPSARDSALKNCGAGISLLSTLHTQVKVNVADDGERLELVAVDEREAGKIGGDPRKAVPGVAYG